MIHSRGFGCLGTIVACLLLVVAGYAGHPWLLRQWGHSLLRSDPLQKADVIVVMSGGYAVRAQEAAALYNEHWGEHLVLTHDLAPPGLAELRSKGIIQLPEMIDVNQRVLEGLGVPRVNIWRVEADVDNTEEEVQYLGKFLKEKGARSLIMVTSKTHSRRSCLAFHHYFGNEFQITCRYSRFDPFDPDSWWKSRTGTREFLFEWEKLLMYQVQFALSAFQ